MARTERIEKAINAMLCMQRQCWEHAVGGRALIHAGKRDLAILFARDAALRQRQDGRPGMVEECTASTDVPQFWSDCTYMAPPSFAALGDFSEAIRQFRGAKKQLWDAEAGMLYHIYDDGKKEWVRKKFWGGGNGWTAAGLAEVIGMLPTTMEAEKAELITWLEELLAGCMSHRRVDGLFHDVVDDPDTFVESNLGQMLAFAIFTGVNGGWLDRRWLEDARIMREAAIGKIDEWGVLQGACGSPFFDRAGTSTEAQAFTIMMETAAAPCMDTLDVICLGELLIDFVSLDRDVSLVESSGFTKAPGGAPANVAAGVAKLGMKAGFIGKVGEDPFGAFLRKVLDDISVDTSFLVADPDARTTLSFVAQKSDGVRDCMFYRNPGADMMLRPEELDASYFSGAAFFHFGSISLGCEPVKSATLRAISLAKQNGLLVSYDPNLRPSLWPDVETARREILAGFALADVVKISDEEYGEILGVETPEVCAEKILGMGPRLVVVTLGPKGCYYSDGIRTGYLPTFDEVTVVETTGAGDAFVAATLTGITTRVRQGDPDALKADETFVRILTFANAAGSIATTKLGAIPSLPTAEQVISFLAVQRERCPDAH